MKVVLNNNDIRKYIKPVYFGRGQEYYARGMVKKVESQLEGRLITATVSGAGRKRYRSQIHIEGDMLIT